MRPDRSTERRGPALLVPQTSFLGDVVLTTPLLSALRKRLRPRRLTVMVRPEARALVAGHPAVDQVMIDDKRGADRGLTGLIKMAARVRREEFDVAVCPHRSLRTAVLLALAGIPRRVGFDESRGAFLFHECVHRDRRLHDVERNLLLLEPLGGAGDTAELHVPVVADAAAHADELLAGDSRPVVVVAPGSVWPTKRWTSSGFAEVIRTLTAKGMRCVLIGAQGDTERAATIGVRSGTDVLDLTGRTSLAVVTAVIDRACLLIGNDSAPMHIARARGVPVIAVFCATTPALGYGPHGDDARVVGAELACRPCGRHGGRSCPRGTDDCRYLVEPAQVMAAAEEFLARARIPPS